MNEIQEASVEYISSLYSFYSSYAWDHLSQDEYSGNWHIEELCKVLEEYKDAIVSREYIEDLIINIPPGSSKSSLVSQAFPVWLWLHDPSITIIVSSYSGGLSVDHSIKAKKLYQNNEFDIFFREAFEALHGKALELVKDNEAIWTNNFGGQYITTSTGGTVTGRHAHVIIRDDPQNPEQTESSVYRKKAHRFNDRTLSSRKKNKGITPTITVMQRLHEDDTTGHELAKVEKEGKKVRHICLPSEVGDNVKPEEYRKFYKDGLLDPIRSSRKVLEDSKIDLGSYGYSGQFLQNPYPEGGGKVKRDWFVFIEESEIPTGLCWDIWIDGAYTANTKNDPSGIMIAANDIANNRIIVRYFKGEYLISPDLVRKLAEHYDNGDFGIDAASTAFIEPKASGITLKDELVDKTYMNARLIKNKLVQAGKEVRINTSSPKIENSRVHLVRGNWNEEFIKQHIGFPNVEHDEAVDLLGYASYEYFY